MRSALPPFPRLSRSLTHSLDNIAGLLFERYPDVSTKANMNFLQIALAVLAATIATVQAAPEIGNVDTTCCGYNGPSCPCPRVSHSSQYAVGVWRLLTGLVLRVLDDRIFDARSFQDGMASELLRRNLTALADRELGSSRRGTLQAVKRCRCSRSVVAREFERP